MRNKHDRRRALAAGAGLASLALALSWGVSAKAETAADTVASSAQPADPDVVVTARKRTERLQDVPISITAVGAAEAEIRGDVRLGDLISEIPNVALIPGQDALTTISVRGVVSQSRYNPGFDSGVGIYVDGVVLGKEYYFNQQLFDLDHVEFLRGPQGTLFGKNSIAGAINLVTRTPSNVFRADADAVVGNYNDREFRGYVSGPVVKDLVYASLSASYSKHDGYVVNAFDGVGANNDNSSSVRGKLVLTPTNNLKITASADYLSQIQILNEGVITSGYGVTNGLQPDQNIDPLAKLQYGGASITADYELNPGLKLTSITAYRGASDKGHSDSDGGPQQVLESFQNRTQRQTTQELRMTSVGDTRFSYVAGFFYFFQRADGMASTLVGPATPVPATYRNAQPNTFGFVSTDSYAAYVNADYKIMPTLTLTGGLRYTNDKQTLNYQQLGAGALGPTLPPEIENVSTSDVSPTASLRWTPSPHQTFYVTVSRGYKDGGWNLDNITSASITSFKQLRFNSESMWNYEAGAKLELFQNRLILDGDVFYEDYTNIQAAQLVPAFPGSNALVSLVTNAASATIPGVELEATLKPITGLVLKAGAGYNDGKFGNYLSGSAATAINYKGNKLPDAPAYTLNLSGEYTHPLTSSLQVIARADYDFRNGYYIDPANTSAYSLPSVGLVNGSIGIGDSVGRWQLFLFGKNIGDKLMVTSRVGGGGTFTPTNTQIIYGAPRTYGVRLALHY